LKSTLVFFGFIGSDFLRDRVFVIADSKGATKTQRHIPFLARVEASVSNEGKLTLALKDASHDSVTVNIPVEGQWEPKDQKTCR